MAAEPGRPTDVSPVGDQAGDREGHRQAVIVEAVRLGPVEPGRAGDAQVVAVDLDPRAEGAQAGGGPGDPVGFLVAELAGAADDGRARPRRSRRGTGRGSRRSRRPRRPARARRRAASDERTVRSASGSPTPSSGASSWRRSVDVGAHRAQDVDDRAAGRVDADVEDRRARRRDGSRRRPARRRRPRRRPGHCSVTARTATPPSTDTATDPSGASVRSTGTPLARSIRSVWSRVATDSRTVVRPSARSPASRMADFTCALGTVVV